MPMIRAKGGVRRLRTTQSATASVPAAPGTEEGHILLVDPGPAGHPGKSPGVERVERHHESDDDQETAARGEPEPAAEGRPRLRPRCHHRPERGHRIRHLVPLTLRRRAAKRAPRAAPWLAPAGPLP